MSLKLFSIPLKYQSPAAMYAAFAGDTHSVFLDSADQAHKDNRYSYIACLPVEVITAKNGVVTLQNREQQQSFEGDPFAVVKERLEAWTQMAAPQDPSLPPFQGGAAGYFGYDLVRGLERLPNLAEDDLGLPDMVVGIYTSVIAFDHKGKTASLLIQSESKASADAMAKSIQDKIKGAPGVPAFDGASMKWFCPDDPKAYEAKIQKTIDYIYAGDIFQANITRRMEATLPEGFDAYAHYCTMRAMNAAPFATFVRAGEVTLSSASPERFLSVHDRQVKTLPIKGTRPRHMDKGRDYMEAQELLNSQKDRAENTMIVDLLRNDLSKVCEDHSIEVPRLNDLESFASVHHLVSEVRGTLRADKQPIDLLKACFPGGSITGAPKPRAMEIIEEMEPVRRGPYCGSVGYIGFHGNMDVNIAIRTLVFLGEKVYLQVGGGIVSDSNPTAEYEETNHKAEAIIRSFQGTAKTQAYS